MDPQLQTLAEILGYSGAALGVLKVVKTKMFDPSRLFVRRVGRTMESVESIDKRTLMTDARQSALMAAQPEPMFESDVAGHFTTANRAFEDLTGYSRAHLTGMEWVNAIHPEDRFRVVKGWDHAVKDQRAWIEKCRIQTASGRTLLVRIEAHPMRESIGDRAVVGWHGTVCPEARA